MKSLWKRSCVKTTDIRNFAGCSIHMRLGVLGKIIFRKHNGAMMIIKNKKQKRILLVCMLSLCCISGCMHKTVEKYEAEINDQIVLVESKTEALYKNKELIFTLKQPITEEYSVLYKCSSVINEQGLLVSDQGLSVFTSIMKNDTVIANDLNHVGIANIDSKLSVNDKNQLILQTSVNYDHNAGDIAFHYLKFITFALIQEKDTYTIRIEDVRGD